MREADTEMAEGTEVPPFDPERPADANLKVEINTLIWMHAPKDLTLADAERLACQIMNGIYAGRL